LLLRHEAAPKEESKERRALAAKGERTNSSPASAGDTDDSQGGSEMEEADELAAPISAEQLVFASIGALRIV
jgi:hypothetical protein